MRAVIARYRNSEVELLHVPLESGEAALPVFSTLRAAGEFLSACASGQGWYARECSAGELLSHLAGFRAGVKWILLDPCSRFAAEPEEPPVSLHTDDFIATLSRG